VLRVTLEDPPPSNSPLRLIGTVWAVIGVLAILIGLVATVTAIAVFGGLALLAGLIMYGLQVARDESAVRTARRLGGGPVSPASAPHPVPVGPPGSVSPDEPRGQEKPPTSPDLTEMPRRRTLYRRRPWLRQEAEAEEAEEAGGSESTDSTDSTDSSGGSDSSGAGEGSDGSDAAGARDDATPTDTMSHSVSEADDGTGGTIDDTGDAGDDTGGSAGGSTAST
jgi:hypothetical protein